MGSMADEMSRRMAEDGGAGLPNGDAGGVVPGNEGAQTPPVPVPAAEPSNTDTTGTNGPPEAIPYARFKEVNDHLAPYRELESYGYDADSLRRLASFEANYLQDPIGTVANLAENLDLPQDVIERIRASAGTGDGATGRAEGEPDANAGAVSTLPPEVQQRLEYVDQLRERDAEAQRQGQLNAVTEAWDRMDAEEKVSTPERFKLAAISMAANSGQQFRTYDELAAAARQYATEFREEVLGSAITRTGREGGAPPALPGSAPPASGPLKFKDLREASRAAEADTMAGKLPPIQ